MVHKLFKPLAFGCWFIVSVETNFAKTFSNKLTQLVAVGWREIAASGAELFKPMAKLSGQRKYT